MQSLKEYLDERGDLSNEDLAVLAQWASERKKKHVEKDWKSPYALIREGCDTLLRRRALHFKENV